MKLCSGESSNDTLGEGGAAVRESNSQQAGGLQDKWNNTDIFESISSVN